MPVVLADEDWETWLGEGGNDPAAAKAACKTTAGIRWTMTKEEKRATTKRGKPTVSIRAVATDKESCDWGGVIKSELDADGYINVDANYRSLFMPPITGTEFDTHDPLELTIRIGPN